MKKNKKRCNWVNLSNPKYVEYHDHEWGRPVHDEHKLFEMLILEGAQAGLSWETILNKREGYQKLYHGFDPKKVARFSAKKLETLYHNPEIVRNKRKIESSVLNAKAFLAVQKEFGSFDAYIWAFVDRKPLRLKLAKTQDYPVATEISQKISKDLKKRGFKFVGPTIIYSFMQAIGMTNDHDLMCYLSRSALDT